jgi:hypothetical protein
VAPSSVAAFCAAPPLGVVMIPVPTVVSVPPVITAPPISCTVEPFWASIVPPVLVKPPPPLPVKYSVAPLVARSVPVLIIPVALGSIPIPLDWLASISPALVRAI